MIYKSCHVNRMLICLAGIRFENFKKIIIIIKNPIEKIVCDGSVMYGVSLGISGQRCKCVQCFCMKTDGKTGRGSDRQIELHPAGHNKVSFTQCMDLLEGFFGIQIQFWAISCYIIVWELEVAARLIHYYSNNKKLKASQLVDYIIYTQQRTHQTALQLQPYTRYKWEF